MKIDMLLLNPRCRTSLLSSSWIKTKPLCSMAENTAHTVEVKKTERYNENDV